MRIKAIFALALALVLISPLGAQLSKQTGTITGTIRDEQGVVLPGAAVTVAGPKLLGQATDVSRADGTYVIRALPPGVYTLTIALPGFATAKKEGIDVHVGMTLELNFSMKQGALAEEVTVVGAAPTVDVRSTKTTLIMDASSLTQLPLNRSVFNVIAAAPGAYQNPDDSQQFLVHGGTGISNTFDVDGVNTNWAADYGIWFSEIGYDSMDEVEVITGGIAAEDTVPGGALINVVTKSGGNAFHGQVQAYYTSEHLSQYQFTKEQLDIFGLSRPAVSVYEVEPTFQLGGPIIKDRLWFFTDVGLQKSNRHSGFIPTTILGNSYSSYDQAETFTKGFLKLTGRITDKLRVALYGSYIKDRAPHNWGGEYTTKEASYDYTDKRWKFNASASWFLDKNSFFEFRSGASGMVDWMLPQPGTEDSASYYDYYTYYSWGRNWRERHSNSTNWQNTVDFTHFADSVLGGDHEFKAGFIHQFIFYNWPWFRKNPLDAYYWDGSPYLFDAWYGSDVYGDAPLGVLFCGPNDGDTYSRGNMLRLGGYVQDSMTIKNRLTLNFGLRYDHYMGYLPAADKKAVAGIGLEIGEAALTPLFGFNALGDMHMNAWKPALQWGALTPRLGFIYDLFGNGKTAVKGSFSVYSDFMSTMYFDTSHPFREWEIFFSWWDDNGNGGYDAPGIDSYAWLDGWGKNPLEFSPDYYQKTVAKHIKSPLYYEYTVGLDHTLARDWSVRLKYIHKIKIHTVDTVYYDPASDRVWNTYESATDWWVPFTTVIPAVGGYPEKTVTMYFMSNDAPAPFYQFRNVPGAKRNYNAVELAFDKKMSRGWSFGGSVILSKTMGNNAGDYGSVWGYGAAYDDANWFVNRYGRVPEDVPLGIKLYGAFKLPYGFMASFFAQAFSGQPYQRTVTVYAPSDWAEAHNVNTLFYYTINVETQGARRRESRNNVDVRLEKEFAFRRVGTLSVFLDVFNLLGDKHIVAGLDPGGYWYPDAENTSSGSYSADYYYGKVTATTGQRVVKLSARFSF